ncbi:unnamed protein product [Adineta ricciae]|uniref:Uncharacterized protein n=1 Tax=Adineta ricciae TaxID=249248 RepID=A0A815TGJ1_ADIRI|nr:unnamed protein product [Adineta ricciae]
MSALGKLAMDFVQIFNVIIISLGLSTYSQPKIGEIHTARISMVSLFGRLSNFDSETDNRSESSSTSSSSQKSSDHLPKRPCVIWNTEPTIQVLAMTRFGGADVADSNVRLFDHLTHEYVLKRLVAVSPKIPYGGRRSISARTKATDGPIKTVNTNLVLIPTFVPEKWKCKTVQEYFPFEELQYINEVLNQIRTEESKESDERLKIVQEMNHLQSSHSNNDHGRNQHDNNSSSSSSSLPRTRARFVEDLHWNKKDFVNKWLDNVQNEYPESLNNSLDDFLVDDQSTVSPFDHI